MRKTLQILTFASLLTLAVGACRRDPPPSPEYAQAFERYLSLRTEHRDQAFLMPEMDALLAQLDAVDPESADAAAAKELQAKIREGQDAARAHQAALEAARGVGGRQLDLGERADPEETVPETAPAGEDPVEQTPQPAYGQTVAQLRAQFSRCFQPGEPMHIPGKGLRDIWVLKDLENCRKLHPKYVKDVVLLEEGKVWGTATPGARIEFPAPDAGVAPAGAATAPTTAPAPPPDAGPAAPAAP